LKWLKRNIELKDRTALKQMPTVITQLITSGNVRPLSKWILGYAHQHRGLNKLKHKSDNCLQSIMRAACVESQGHIVLTDHHLKGFDYPRASIKFPSLFLLSNSQENDDIILVVRAVVIDDLVKYQPSTEQEQNEENTIKRYEEADKDLTALWSEQHDSVYDLKMDQKRQWNPPLHPNGTKLPNPQTIRELLYHAEIQLFQFVGLLAKPEFKEQATKYRGPGEFKLQASVIVVVGKSIILPLKYDHTTLSEGVTKYLESLK